MNNNKLERNETSEIEFFIKKRRTTRPKTVIVTTQTNTILVSFLGINVCKRLQFVFDFSFDFSKNPYKSVTHKHY